MSESEQYPTGGQRSSSTGRGRYDLIPAEGLARLAARCEEGAQAYGEDNWKKGLPLRRYINSMFRHITQYNAGDREEDHLAAIAWNALALASSEVLILQGAMSLEMDDIGHVKQAISEMEDAARRAAAGQQQSPQSNREGTQQGPIGSYRSH
jgi:hypothetical protein